MKSQNVFLRLLCILCVSLMLVGMLSACGDDTTDPTNPTEGPTEGPTDGPEDPTNGTDTDPTQTPGGNEDDPDSPIMDGDGHVEVPVG